MFPCWQSIDRFSPWLLPDHGSLLLLLSRMTADKELRTSFFPSDPVESPDAVPTSGATRFFQSK
jgi:hypothetical protein